MPEYINNKIIQDVRDTGDEADRLLADLENGFTSQASKQHLDNASSNNKNSKYKYKESLNTASMLAGPAILVSFIMLFVIANTSNTNTASAPSNRQSISEPIPQPARKKKSFMNSAQRKFYNQTLAKASNAVLIKEHEAVISDLKILNRGVYRDLSDVDQGLVNNKIIQAKKKIKFLDQEGKLKYWEQDNYGAQWFDKSPDGQFKIFLAYSKVCKSPVVTFGFMSESGGTIRARHIIRPTSNLSTLFIPMKLSGQQWITLEKFQCN